MNQSERQIYLIKELLKEMPRYRGLQIPDGEEERMAASALSF